MPTAGDGQAAEITHVVRSWELEATDLHEIDHGEPGSGRCFDAGTVAAIACAGQLGNGAAPADSTVPVPVSGITDATAIEAGAAHTCARLSSGTVKCWGWNEYGGLGDNTDNDRNTPVPVSGITDATAVTGGLEHSCALRSNAAMVCWGYGGDGELGNGGNANSFTPVPVTGFP